MLAHFPNLYIGITGTLGHLCIHSFLIEHTSAGVITYSSNLNTATVIREMMPSASLRIVLETDAPYMVPNNIYQSIPEFKGKRIPLCHTAMLPWTAEFVSRVAAEAGGSWDIENVMQISRDNARHMYGI
jgi:TatD DNase family protein